MRYSQMLLPTAKETPSEAEVVSHQLLVRGGFIRKLTSGMYTFLPLGFMALQKVTDIVRQEMNRAGAQEILMPMVQPGDLWQESGRWQKYGPELLRFRDRHEREYCLGPTHEEVVTDIARREMQSYRQLPVNLYQIQTKFRDEIRPRFGLMRCREFVMKDAYSFDVDDAGASQSYETMRDAYHRIFTRCGLDFRAVEADSGAIGGSFSHEFMVLAETGEDTLVICRSCSYAANVEKAAIAAKPIESTRKPVDNLVRAETPGIKKVEKVAEFFKVRPSEVIKTLFYHVDKTPVAVLVRGDRVVQSVKLKNLLGATDIAPLDEEQIWEQLRLPAGYLGPVGLAVKVVADQEIMGMVNSIAGANEKGHHFTGVNPGRDFQPEVVGDLRQIDTSDHCPSCGGDLELKEGIEVGHIFKLGTGYSDAMHATFQDSDGQEKSFVMGCYGIGVSRVVAAAIEQNHDSKGIIFPLPLAPFQVIILNLGPKDERYCQAAEQLYTDLRSHGLDVLLDDRDERPGSKFNDADLLGIPYRLTVGKIFAEEGKVELRSRKTGAMEVLALEGSGAYLADLIQSAL
ncbi:proline--tRNA ligase [Desulfobulbus alkaliphilus]|uniref:proline--tRNA ligase n=1 Tax=Desulfobulbus alkaliphilus TaxID=869814 RepID=UPI001962981E|nr:proline--tRNA ligase [Desulfobulbus alkaliphilus]MBM9535869.1 proline--tRNA ligase [Desulfobulbus alkaliphilus]